MNNIWDNKENTAFFKFYLYFFRTLFCKYVNESYPIKNKYP